MGTHKQYIGYRSYQYLDEGRDYRSFALAKEIGRVPSRQIVLSPAEEQRVQALLAK
ncbi:MAG: diguanylate cyclase, partial [Deltaproteobacteria bacterium]|nr:diguanylate cyclase [Deltaproteobacteria bacterium]